MRSRCFQTENFEQKRLVAKRRCQAYLRLLQNLYWLLRLQLQEHVDCS